MMPARARDRAVEHSSYGADGPHQWRPASSGWDVDWTQKKKRRVCLLAVRAGCLARRALCVTDPKIIAWKAVRATAQCLAMRDDDGGCAGLVAVKVCAHIHIGIFTPRAPHLIYPDGLCDVHPSGVFQMMSARPDSIIERVMGRRGRRARTLRI